MKELAAVTLVITNLGAEASARVHKANRWVRRSRLSPRHGEHLGVPLNGQKNERASQQSALLRRRDASTGDERWCEHAAAERRHG